MKVAFVAAALMSFASSAFAADLPSRREPAPFVPPPPMFSWTGFYAGLNLGAMSKDRTGVIGGAQIGYNWQTGPVVYGLEADFNGHSSISNNNDAFGYGSSNSGSGYLGTVRGRIGFLATPTFLIYATGGLAYGNTWSSANNGLAYTLYPDLAGSGLNSNQNSFKAGYTIGGGLEYSFAPNWSVKAEYLYVDLGRQSSDYFGTASRSTAHVARLGINYHFNWGGAAPVVARY